MRFIMQTQIWADPVTYGYSGAPTPTSAHRDIKDWGVFYSFKRVK